jgi:hypothetical protein
MKKIPLINYLVLITLTASLGYSLKVNAAQHIAVAKIVKGDVTYLALGAKNARKLKRGVKLYKDSSVYVNGKGFAKIQYINSSSVTVGPNSKVALEMDLKDKTSLVNLVSGKIRAAVDKNAKNDKKFLVRTSSATMGVRGTEFQVSFAPKAKKTSLLTFDGRVDMKKSSEISKKISASNQVSEMKEMLNDNPTAVKKGDFLRIAKDDTVKSEKVKINPKQFVLMKKDNSLGAKKVVLTKKEKIDLNKEAKALEKDFAKELEESDTNKVSDLGYVDFDKGVYIPPVDSKKKKYLGKVGADGSYIPPKGVEIDETKGIVLKAKASKQIKEFVDKTNEDNQVPEAVRKSNNNAYERYFDV